MFSSSVICVGTWLKDLECVITLQFGTYPSVHKCTRSVPSRGTCKCSQCVAYNWAWAYVHRPHVELNSFSFRSAQVLQVVKMEAALQEYQQRQKPEPAKTSRTSEKRRKKYKDKEKHGKKDSEEQDPMLQKGMKWCTICNISCTDGNWEEVSGMC